MADDDSGEGGKKRPEPPPIEFLKPGETQAPPPSQQGPVAWVTRPEEYQQPVYPVGPAPPRPPPSGRLGLAAGVLLVLSGVVGIGYTVYSSLLPLSYSDYLNLTADQATFVTNQICGILVIAAQMAALLGGIMAIQRLNWRLTMVCAILATLTLGFYLSASFMGLAGFTLVLLARKEFRS